MSITEAELRAYAKTDGKWRDLASSHGIKLQALHAALSVLGIKGKSRAAPAMTKILRALGPGAMTITELVGATGRGYRMCSKAIATLRAKGLVEKVEERARVPASIGRPWAVYALTESGEQSINTGSKMTKRAGLNTGDIIRQMLTINACMKVRDMELQSGIKNCTPRKAIDRGRVAGWLTEGAEKSPHGEMMTLRLTSQPAQEGHQDEPGDDEEPPVRVAPPNLIEQAKASRTALELAWSRL